MAPKIWYTIFLLQAASFSSNVIRSTDCPKTFICNGLRKIRNSFTNIKLNATLYIFTKYEYIQEKTTGTHFLKLHNGQIIENQKDQNVVIFFWGGECSFVFCFLGQICRVDFSCILLTLACAKSKYLVYLSNIELYCSYKMSIHKKK